MTSPEHREHPYPPASAATDAARAPGVGAGGDARAASHATAAVVFPGGGEMGARCRTFDWAATPLGPVETWPQSLRTAAGLVLGAAFPMIVLWGPELVQLYNDGYREVMGAKHPAGLGQPTRACWPEVWHINEPIYARVRAGETVWVEEALYPLLRNGPDAPPDDVYINVSFSRVPDEALGVGGVLVMLVDVTAQVTGRAAEAERARLAAALEAERTTLLEEVFRRAPSFLHVLRGPAFVFEFANDAYYQLVGRRDLIGRPAFQAVPEAVAGGAPERIARVMATGEPFVGREVAATLARTPGEPPEERLIDLVYLPLVDADGACTRVLGHGTDVTEHVHARRRAEADRARLLAEVAAERERLRSLILEMPAPVALLVGPEHRFELVNAAYRRISGGGRDITGLTQREAFPEIAGQGFYELFDRVYATGEAWLGPETLARYDRDGTGVEDAWFDIRLEPVRDADGRVVALLNFLVDVTSQVRARREVERLLAASEAARGDAEAARAEAEAANRAKAEFLATMSHELRTPLNAIGGYAELLELGIRGPVAAQQVEDLRRIQASQRHLLGLVNEVLNYARIETGTVRYDLADVPLAGLVASVEPLVAPQLAARRLAFTHHGCGDTPLVVRADREKVRQVLLNLLSNAVKFTDPGGQVTVACAAAGDRVAVRVGDTGIGIAPAELGRIFEPFVQVNARLTRTHEGVGLGLAISRDLARGMGGDLTAESTPGAGSTFTLTLPRAPREHG